MVCRQTTIKMVKQVPYILALVSSIYGNVELCRYILQCMVVYRVGWLSLFGFEFAFTSFSIIYFSIYFVRELVRLRRKV